MNKDGVTAEKDCRAENQPSCKHMGLAPMGIL